MRPLARLAVSAAITLATLSTSWSASAAEALQIWIHGSRGTAEPQEIQRQVKLWNQLNPAQPAEVVVLEKAYADKMIAARALAGTWPDILDFDGPSYANAAWSGRLAPLDGLLPEATLKRMLPSVIAQGTYAPDGKVYVLGQFESGLGLWGSRSALQKAGVRIPRGMADAWTTEEFEGALEALRRIGYATPIDVKLSYGIGEWFTYGFLPIVQSFGGDIVDRETWRAEGTINGRKTVAAVARIKSWADKGYFVPASAGDDAFYGAKRTAALAFVGHWMWPSHSKALGDDLVLLPMPKFGERHVTGMGSWNWGIWSGSPRKEAAGRLLDFLMSDQNVEAMSAAAGAIPASRPVAERLPVFARGGAMQTYVDQLVSIATPRPSHPAYPVMTAAFATALAAAIMEGQDPQRALDRAAATIDQEIDQTSGYKPFGG